MTPASIRPKFRKFFNEALQTSGVGDNSFVVALPSVVLDDIFPIRFEGIQGLATGIVSGELNGFYRTVFTRGKPPRVAR
jgi:hypothetical protein